MTGADSPVMALSSTEAAPSMTSPSAGICSPAWTMTISPFCREAEGTRVICSFSLSRGDLVGLHILSGGPQGVRLGLAPALGDGLGKVGEQTGQPQDDGDGQDIARRSRP